MNNNDIYSIDFTRSLPPALKNDPKMIALAQAIAEQLQINAQLIDRNIIYARIDELDEKTLDVLAYDLHVDWYDYSYPIEVKRQTIKDSVKVHRKLGTKYAVETALGAVFPGTKVREWFEYGGKPYTFRVIIGITSAGLSAARQTEVLNRIRFYKNLRSHLEAISYEVKKETTIYVAAAHSIGTRLEVYPYLAKDVTAAGTLHVAAAVKSGTRLEVFPVLVKSLTARATVHAGAVVKTGTKVEIYPVADRG